METMRREGYEFAVSRPRVILRSGANGEKLEPYEEVTVDVPETLMGPVIEKLGQRRGEMLEMRNPGGGLVRLIYRVPARGLFGYRSEFLTDTRGEGIAPPPLPRLRPLRRAHEHPRPRRGRQHDRRRLRRLRHRPAPGAHHLLHRARHPRLRGHDRRRERPPRRHGGQRHQGEEAHQHARLRLRRQRPPGAAAPHDASRTPWATSPTTSSSRSPRAVLRLRKRLLNASDRKKASRASA